MLMYVLLLLQQMVLYGIHHADWDVSEGYIAAWTTADVKICNTIVMVIIPAIVIASTGLFIALIFYSQLFKQAQVTSSSRLFRLFIKVMALLNTLEYASTISILLLIRDVLSSEADMIKIIHCLIKEGILTFTAIAAIVVILRMMAELCLNRYFIVEKKEQNLCSYLKDLLRLYEECNFFLFIFYAGLYIVPCIYLVSVYPVQIAFPSVAIICTFTICLVVALAYLYKAVEPLSHSGTKRSLEIKRKTQTFPSHNDSA